MGPIYTLGLAKMRHRPLTWSLTIAVALTGMTAPFSDAWADARAGEKKAQLCLLCHRVDATVGAPTLEQQSTKYLVVQTLKPAALQSLNRHFGVRPRYLYGRTRGLSQAQRVRHANANTLRVLLQESPG